MIAVLTLLVDVEEGALAAISLKEVVARGRRVVLQTCLAVARLLMQVGMDRIWKGLLAHVLARRNTILGGCDR